jgi:hypothetical protein
MKTFSLVLLTCLIGLSVSAQTTPIVTITVNGSRIKEVRVDGQTYAVNTDVNAVSKNLPITVNNLELGHHTIEVIRTTQSNTTRTNSTTFNLRTGYDMKITVNSNGSVQLSESRIKRTTVKTANRTPMTETEFNTLLNQVQSHWTSSGRTTELNKIFANTSYYFTTAQAKQLISQVNSQATRLSLAKMAYKMLTDPVNYTVLNELFTSTSRKNDFNAYVVKYNQDNPNAFAATDIIYPGHLAMSDSDFDQLFSEVEDQSSTSAKTTYLSNIFRSTGNYFTTAQIRELLQQAYYENDRLTLAKSAYDNVVDPVNYTQLYDLFTYQTSRNDLADFIGTSATGAKVAMSSVNFNKMYNEAKSKYPSTAKYTYIASVLDNALNYMTVSQLRQLIQLVYSDNDRLQLAKAAYDNVTDMSAYYLLGDLFSGQAARNDFAAFVQNAGVSGHSTIRTPMTETDFNALYRDIQMRFGIGVKMSALTDAFNNKNYYFTTAQARQLVQLVSSETNRLDLAKAAYRNITDPENFSQIYDVFSRQESKDELANYIKTYK